MVYPYLDTGMDLRRRLIGKGIFVAQYWPEVKNIADQYSIEYQLAQYLVPLPIDQRLSMSDMDTILRAIEECTSTAN
jgi:hypothetical protein